MSDVNVPVMGDRSSDQEAGHPPASNTRHRPNPERSIEADAQLLLDLAAAASPLSTINEESTIQDLWTAEYTPSNLSQSAGELGNPPSTVASAASRTAPVNLVPPSPLLRASLLGRARPDHQPSLPAFPSFTPVNTRASVANILHQATPATLDASSLVAAPKSRARRVVEGTAPLFDSAYSSTATSSSSNSRTREQSVYKTTDPNLHSAYPYLFSSGAPAESLHEPAYSSFSSSKATVQSAYQSTGSGLHTAYSSSPSSRVPGESIDKLTSPSSHSEHPSLSSNTSTRGVYRLTHSGLQNAHQTTSTGSSTFPPFSASDAQAQSAYESPASSLQSTHLVTFSASSTHPSISASKTEVQGVYNPVYSVPNTTDLATVAASSTQVAIPASKARSSRVVEPSDRVLRKKQVPYHRLADMAPASKASNKRKAIITKDQPAKKARTEVLATSSTAITTAGPSTTRAQLKNQPASGKFKKATAPAAKRTQLTTEASPSKADTDNTPTSSVDPTTTSTNPTSSTSIVATTEVKKPNNPSSEAEASSSRPNKRKAKSTEVIASKKARVTAEAASSARRGATPNATMKGRTSVATTAKGRSAATSRATKPRGRTVATRGTTTTATTATHPTPKNEDEDQEESPTPPPPPSKKPRVAKQPKEPKRKTVINQVPTQKLDVFVWGEGALGELGLGNLNNAINVKRPRLHPHLSASEVGVVQIATGGMHSAALTHDNLILTWGVNDQGALGRDTTWTPPPRTAQDNDTDDDDDDNLGFNPLECIPVAIPRESFPEGVVFTQVACGDSMTFAVTDDGDVYGWGTFRSNEGIMGFTEEVLIQETPIKMSNLSKITQVTCGANHVCALRQNGEVYIWGSGEQNQLGHRMLERKRYDALIPSRLRIKKPIRLIGCGHDHSFAVDRDNNTWTWGLNNFGETSIREGAGGDRAVVFNPVKVPSLNLLNDSITTITGGAHHSVATTANGVCLVWGRLDGKQMGLDIASLPKDNIIKDAKDHPRILIKPTALPADSIGAATMAAVGTDHTICINAAGEAFSWGFNVNYQCGQGTDTDIEAPTRINNTAVRNRALIWAGAGSQFSVATALAA